MNVRMVGEVITKGVNAQEDTCFSFWNSCRGGQAFGEGIGYDAAERGKALPEGKEIYPGNKQWGTDGLSYPTLGLAHAKLLTITQKEGAEL